MLLIMNIDFTAMNLALPAIAQTFNARLNDMQWVIVSFALATAIFMVTTGYFSNIIGKKIILLTGILLFTLFSFTAGMSFSESFLIFNRFMQGLGVALSFPIINLIVFEIFPVNKRGYALGILTAVVGIGQAIGPSIGGIIIHLFSWRWIFFINIPIGILSFVLLLYLYNETNVKKASFKNFDLFGNILLALGLLFIFLALNELNTFKTVYLIILIFLGIFSLSGFFVLEAKKEHPLIENKVFCNFSYVNINIIRMCMQFVFMTILFLMGFYLRNILGYSYLFSGYILLYLTVSFGVISPIGGKLVDLTGAKLSTSLSMLLFMFSFGLFSYNAFYSNIYLLAIALLLSGLGIGINFISTTHEVLHIYPNDSIAAGIFFTNSVIGSSLGVSFSGFLLNHISVNRLNFLLQKNEIILSSKSYKILAKTVSGIRPISDLKTIFSENLSNEIIQLAKSSFSYAFFQIMFLCLLISLIGFILTFFMKKNVRT